MQTPEETAQTLIANAGFRDSRVIPTAVVKGMLIEVLSGAIQRERVMSQMLEDFTKLQTSPIVLRRAVDAGLSGRIARLESQSEKECPADVDEVQFFSVSASETYTRVAPPFYCGDYESGVLCRCTIQCNGCAMREKK